MISLKIVNRNSLLQFFGYLLLFSIILVFGIILGNYLKKCNAGNSFCPSSFPSDSSANSSLAPNKEISDIYSFEYPDNFFIDYRTYEFVSLTNKKWQGEIVHFPVVAVKQYVLSIPDDMDLKAWIEGIGDPNAPIGDNPAKSCKEFIAKLKSKLNHLGFEEENCLFFGVSGVKDFQLRNLPAITFKTENVSESGTHTLVRYKNSANVTILVDIYRTITGMVDDKEFEDSQIDQVYQKVLNTIIFKSVDNQAKQKLPVKLYYYNSKADSKGDCSKEAVLPVEREIDATKTPIQDTLTLLIKGSITDTEKSQGFGSEFPYTGFKLLSAKLEKGVLTLDFPVIPSFTSGGSCRIGLIVSQIEKTAKQFPEVKEVRYSKSELFQP